MSITPTAPSVVPGLPAGARLRPPGSTGGPAPRVRRVRHQARETLALMVFSAAASVGVSAVLLLAMSLGR